MEFGKFVLEILGALGLVILLAFSSLTFIVGTYMKKSTSQIIKFLFTIIVIAMILIFIFYVLIDYKGNNKAILKEKQQNSFFVRHPDNYPLNLRYSPSTKAKIINTLPSDLKKIEILEITRNSKNKVWYKIKYEGEIGWSSATFIHNEYGKYQVNLSSNKYTLSVREEPRKLSKELGRLPYGDKDINIIDISRNDNNTPWYKIYHCDIDDETIIGWVSGKLLKREE